MGIVDFLCKKNPENKWYRIFLLDIASEGKKKKEFAALLNDLEKDFVLTEKDQKQIVVFRNRLEAL